MTNSGKDLQSYLVSWGESVILNPSCEFLCRNFTSIDSVFQVLGRLPAEMFGGLKKICFFAPIFGAGEAACRQAVKVLSKTPLFNYIVQLEGLLYVNRAVFHNVGSCTHHLAAKGTWPSSKARHLGKTYKFISGLRCNGHFPFLVTCLKFVPVPAYKRLQTEIVGTGFLKIYSLYRFKNCENSYGQRNQ